ncbi:hypothetical protein V1514DRAFT_330363 [Lipomyces japonicus]|uniref:uncharacterized protein n=1 Tax=Lipomyces japonicus TaxID=56871 RepID=UPI0034CDCB1B
MRFFTTLASIASLATAALAASTVKLTAKSDSSEVNGKGLYYIHEGAAINYVFLGDGAADLVYYSENGTFYAPDSQYPFALGIVGSIVQVGVAGTTEFTISSGKLAVNGSTAGFYAAKNTNDPYDYSASAYEVLYYSDKSAAPSDAIAITVVVSEDAAVSSSVVASATLTAASSTSASSSASSSASTVVKLEAKSSDSSVDGKSLSSIHEGAGFNYVFLGQNGEPFVFYPGNGSLIAADIDFEFPYAVGIQDNIVTVGILGPTAFTITDGTLAVNGSSSGFYAAKNTNDPYSYSKESFQVLYYADKSDAPSGAVAITIVVAEGNSNTTTSAVTSSAIPTSTPAYKNSTSIVTVTKTNSTVSATASKPAEFTGAAAVNKVSGVLAIGAAVFALLA